MILVAGLPFSSDSSPYSSCQGSDNPGCLDGAPRSGVSRAAIQVYGGEKNLCFPDSGEISPFCKYVSIIHREYAIVGPALVDVCSFLESAINCPIFYPDSEKINLIESKIDPLKQPRIFERSAEGGWIRC